MNVFELFAKIGLDSSEYDKGMNDAEKTASGFQEKFNEGTSKMKEGLKGVATGAGILTAVGAGAFKMADGVSKNLDSIDKMSQKLGFSTDAYQEWDYVLQLSGSSMENMSMGIKTLTNKFDDAKGGSQSAIESFERLGLSMDDIQGMSQEDLFKEVIFAFQNMEDGADRAALANDLLGRSGQELAPLFNSTAEETQGYIDKVHDLGGVMSEDAVKEGARFQDSLTSLKTAFTGASGELFEKLIPAITNLMDKITEFIESGGLERIITTLQNLAPVIGIVVAAFATFSIINGIVSMVEGFTVAFGALNAVMMANPIALVVAAVVALIAIFALLWAKCEGFRQFFLNMWEGIKEAFNGVVEFFKNAFNNIGEFASNLWGGLKEGASTAWSNVKGAFASVGGWFKEKFNSAKEKAVGAWDNVKSKFTTVWGKIKDGFSIKDALTWGKDMLDNFIQGIKDKIGAVGEAVKGVASKIKSILGFSEPEDGPLSNFHTYAPDMMALFAKGVKDNTDLVTDQLKQSFDFSDIIASPQLAIAGGGTMSQSGNMLENISSMVSEALGGLTVQVNIGQDRVDDLVVKAIQRNNYRSGGR